MILRPDECALRGYPVSQLIGCLLDREGGRVDDVYAPARIPDLDAALAQGVRLVAPADSE
jgi:hypothetical protein